VLKKEHAVLYRDDPKDDDDRCGTCQRSAPLRMMFVGDPDPDPGTNPYRRPTNVISVLPPGTPLGPYWQAFAR
jgi:hypothetical protein